MAELRQLQALQNTFATLSQRERRMVVAAGLVAAAFLVFLVTASFSGKANSIRERTAKKLEKLEEAQSLAAGYAESRGLQEAAERRLAASNVRLGGYLEDLATQKGLQPSFNPRADVSLEGTRIIETGMELTLTDVKLNRLIEFLQAVEAGPGIVKVKYLRLEPRVQSESLTAWVNVVTYHMKN